MGCARLQGGGERVDDLGVTVIEATWFDDVEEPEAPAGIDHVVLRLGAGRYAVAAPDVTEVIAMPVLTRVPGTPPWVCGVANWRGHVVPVIDLRPVLAVAAGPLPSSARVVVISVDDVEVGLVAEAVEGLVPVPEGCDPPPLTLVGDAADLVVGLVERGPASGPVAVLATSSILALRSRLGRSRT
jgi:purine-binding chemotaxis protein CheW